ncbi:PTS sugar transporter subunit IIA [Cognatilysobacter terrigena]|uniref:PTS sugar transporter subunit IIA n=1 Tax=Cognatilysobacter terrigena TaxID=2488749 RepID=UPI0010601073|nr:PTS sugar transporter subunit IIA [Lysobacter terrigena]
MPFADLLSRERIERIDAPLDLDGVIEHVATLLARPVEGHGLPAGEVAERLREREKLASTALGHGVAIPHARMASLDTARGAFIRLMEPVPFAAPDARPVDLLFAMVVPEDDVAGHLAQLGEIAQRFADADFRDALRAADDNGGLVRHLLGTDA